MIFLIFIAGFPSSVIIITSARIIGNWFDQWKLESPPIKALKSVVIIGTCCTVNEMEAFIQISDVAIIVYSVWQYKILKSCFVINQFCIRIIVHASVLCLKMPLQFEMISAKLKMSLSCWINVFNHRHLTFDNLTLVVTKLSCCYKWTVELPWWVNPSSGGPGAHMRFLSRKDGHIILLFF